MCVFVCVSQPGGGRGRAEVRFHKPRGSTSTTTTTPLVFPSSSSLQPRQSQARGSWGLAQTHKHTHTHTNTHTHALELQLCTTSQSNTSLLSKQHQNTPTTFHRRAEGFLVITQPPAAMLEALSSRGTVTVKAERGLITGLHIYLVIVVSGSNCLFRM